MTEVASCVSTESAPAMTPVFTRLKTPPRNAKPIRCSPNFHLQGLHRIREKFQLQRNGHKLTHVSPVKKSTNLDLLKGLSRIRAQRRISADASTLKHPQSVNGVTKPSHVNNLSVNTPVIPKRKVCSPHTPVVPSKVPKAAGQPPVLYPEVVVNEIPKSATPSLAADVSQSFNASQTFQISEKSVPPEPCCDAPVSVSDSAPYFRQDCCESTQNLLHKSNNEVPPLLRPETLDTEEISGVILAENENHCTESISSKNLIASNPLADKDNLDAKGLQLLQKLNEKLSKWNHSVPTEERNTNSILGIPLEAFDADSDPSTVSSSDSEPKRVTFKLGDTTESDSEYAMEDESLSTVEPSVNKMPSAKARIPHQESQGFRVHEMDVLPKPQSSEVWLLLSDKLQTNLTIISQRSNSQNGSASNDDVGSFQGGTGATVQDSVLDAEWWPSKDPKTGEHCCSHSPFLTPSSFFKVAPSSFIVPVAILLSLNHAQMQPLQSLLAYRYHLFLLVQNICYQDLMNPSRLAKHLPAMPYFFLSRLSSVAPLSPASRQALESMIADYEDDHDDLDTVKWKDAQKHGACCELYELNSSICLLICIQIQSQT
jgi:hypothetical protein